MDTNSPQKSMALLLADSDMKFVHMQTSYEMARRARARFVFPTLTMPPPQITRIEQPAPRVIICHFSDGNSEKAVCSEDDTFSLETGIMVCLLKHSFGRKAYYSLMKQSRKLLKLQEEAAQKEAEAEGLARRKREKAIARKEAQKKRAEAKQVEVLATAFEKALRATQTN